MDRLRLALGAHHAGFAQHRKVLGERGLAERYALVELTDRQRQGHQVAQDHQALLVGECPQDTDRFLAVRLQVAAGARERAGACGWPAGSRCHGLLGCHDGESVMHGFINRHLLN